MLSTRQQHISWFGLVLTLLPGLVLANNSPSISGNPASTIAIGTEYYFQPQISDADGDDLSLLTRRKPDWLNFRALKVNGIC